jgi:hypothetical protein
MSNNQNFTLRRLALLIRNDIVSHAKMIIITLATVFALLLIFWLIFSPNIIFPNQNPVAYTWILFVGGLWLTSHSFRELHHSQKSYHFLTLPASQLEKVFSRLLLTTLIYIVATLLLYGLFYLVVSVILFIKTGVFQWLFFPLQENVLRWISTYLVLQSIIFLGAVYFRKHAVIKTVACVVLFLMVLSIYILLLDFLFPVGIFSLSKHAFYLHDILHFVVYVLLPVYCWVVAYIRFTECENF